MPKDEMDRSQAIAGVKSPEDFYWVLSQPAPLAGMRRPWPEIPWSSLAKAGFMTVICLDGGSSNYDPAPLEKFDAVSLEDLIHGGPPRHEKHEEQLIREVVAAILTRLRAGQGVVV